MKKDNKKTKGALWSSNLFSLLGTSTAICCAGPGLAGCAVACAPTCGSVGLSLFGLSATGVAHWMSHYWYVFFLLSMLSFSEAFYRIYFLNKARDQRKSKWLFFSSLLLSVVLFVKILLGC